MKNFLFLFAVCMFSISATAAFAGDSHYKDSAEYKELDSQMRTHLQECLKNTQMTTGECMKDTKKTFKSQKKEIKKKYK